MTTTISLCFLTYNRLGIVSRCFKSLLPTLLERDDADWIILDNGSTDGTADWLLKLAARYPRIRVILSAANLGVAGGRQRLLDEARSSDIIAFLDSDVEAVAPDWLDRLTAPLADPKVGVVGGSGFFIKPGWTWYEPATEPGIVDTVAGYCQAFRRDAVDGFAFDMTFNPYWHEDTFMCMWIRERGYDILWPGDVGLRHIFSNSANASSADGQRKQRYLASLFAGKGLVKFERQEHLQRLRQNVLVLD